MRLLTSFGGFAAAIAGLTAGGAMAQGLEIVGRPVDGKMGFQPPATELAQDLQGLDHMILIIITVISIFVTGLLLWVAYRFNQRRNAKPATFTHNSPLEVAWTVVPILILVFIGAFSLPVLFKQQEIPVGDVTIKVTGYQWYWGYEYVDDGVSFDSYMIGAPATGGENRLTPEVERQLVDAGYSKEEFLLATDTAIVVPVNKTIVMQVTGADVIHSWKIPAFGVMQDAVPGRLAHLWFKADREGIYFGQCSELCGIAHAYMPITVKVVSQEVYDKWLEGAKAGDVVLSAADVAEYSTIKFAASN
ncbi:MAG: cytochrome c oxidase subunit II [Rhodobacteraceae bacterium]|nr:cytochrome c oxidase subunit II [Paracoccaceae bacterium]MCF8513714.1 cytochrome c oxidase subunit II [Paracoccaceae bacterium]MCF8517959.1 cytochrome c oxidase subunit II [Paracoccaceae bacterium]